MVTVPRAIHVQLFQVETVVEVAHVILRCTETHLVNLNLVVVYL